MLVICSFFFFKQKTAYDILISDWSSDVCSSDLWGTLEGTSRTSTRPVPTMIGGVAKLKAKKDGCQPSSAKADSHFAATGPEVNANAYFAASGPDRKSVG